MRVDLSGIFFNLSLKTTWLLFNMTLIRRSSLLELEWCALSTNEVCLVEILPIICSHTRARIYLNFEHRPSLHNKCSLVCLSFGRWQQIWQLFLSHTHTHEWTVFSCVIYTFRSFKNLFLAFEYVLQSWIGPFSAFLRIDRPIWGRLRKLKIYQLCLFPTLDSLKVFCREHLPLFYLFWPNW